MSDWILPMKKDMDWYEELVSECKAILVERFYNSNIEAITAYGEVGERIYTDENYRKSGKGNRGFNKKLFEDIGIGERTGYYCLQFFEKKLDKVLKAGEYKDVCTAVQSLYPKNITWNKVRAELPEHIENKEDIPLPDGQYNVVYADPPWSYEEHGVSVSGNYGGATNHYPTMTIEEIRDLPIKDLASDNSVLFIWVTSPKLNQVWEIIASWGFEYKTSFVWDKVKHNFGYYNSVRHELLLVCGRGSSTPEVSKLFDSVLSIERSDQHSEKPQEFRKIIETLYPSYKKIELFARNKTEGWDVWGNEV